MKNPNDPLSLALLYHLNSRPPSGYVSSVPANELRYIPDTPFISLPEVARDTTLAKLLNLRKSVRKFRKTQIPLTLLSQLLYAGFGISELRDIDGHSFEARTFPSAGGLYPIEAFVATQAVEELPDGLYHYDSFGHGLHRVGEVVPESFIDPFLQQDYVANANALIFLTAVFMRTMFKYGDRGYRFIHLEAGHQAQNLCLMAVELGLGSLCIGGYDDTSVNMLLGIDGRRHAAIYCVAVGEAMS